MPAGLFDAGGVDGRVELLDVEVGREPLLFSLVRDK